MPQSLVKNLLHLVFSTKDRSPFIDENIRPSLHDYAGGILRDLNSPALLMNSVPDHIHILFNLHKTKSLSDVVMQLKRSTSIWMKDQHHRYNEFYWQAGYGAFSVSQSAVEVVKEYIANQASHHAKTRFKMNFVLY